MSSPWILDDGTTITLLTPAEFEALPDGTRLVCIEGTTVTKGIDRIDEDTRFVHLAYGLRTTERAS